MRCGDGLLQREEVRSIKNREAFERRLLPLMNRESELLKKWTIEASVPPNFNSAVWRRIGERRRLSVAAAIQRWVTEVFARPAVAVAYLSLTLVVGLAAAQVQASKVLRVRDRQQEARYVQSVDPYAPRVIK